MNAETPDPVAAFLAGARERASYVTASAMTGVGANQAARNSAADVPPLLAVLEAVLTVHKDFEGRCTTCWEFCTCIEDALDAAPMATEEMHRKVFEAWDACPHGNTLWPCPTHQAISRALPVARRAAMGATEEARASDAIHRGCGGMVLVTLDGEICAKCRAELREEDWLALGTPPPGATLDEWRAYGERVSQESGMATVIVTVGGGQREWAVTVEHLGSYKDPVSGALVEALRQQQALPGEEGSSDG